MVTHEELTNIANETFKKLYTELKEHNEYSTGISKREIVLNTFFDNLIFEEFFGDILDKKENKELYRNTIASYTAFLIENNEGRITIQELVDIFKEYETEEDKMFKPTKSNTPNYRKVASKKYDTVEPEEDDFEVELSDGTVISINDDRFIDLPNSSNNIAEQHKNHVFIVTDDIKAERKALNEMRKTKKSIFKKRK